MWISGISCAIGNGMYDSSGVPASRSELINTYSIGL
jgi:hypothetical protein